MRKLSLLRYFTTFSFITFIITGIDLDHKKFSGEGYLDDLKGYGIPIESSIIAVADTYDKMTSDRPYRKGLSQDEAINEIIK